MHEKKHWDGDLADLTGQCVKVGHEMVSFYFLVLLWNLAYYLIYEKVELKGKKEYFLCRFLSWILWHEFSFYNEIN